MPPWRKYSHSFGVSMRTAASNSTPVEVVTLSACALGALVVLASLRHRDRFADGLGTWLWFGGFALAAVAFGLVFLLFDLRGRSPHADGPTPDASLRAAE